MKKLFTLLVLIATIATNAQAPQGFNYQATVRNSSGQLLVNQIVLVKFNILQNSSTGTIVYSESQSANTDDLGHIALVVGKGTATTGTFSTINWGNGTYYLGIELNSGTGYVAMGTTQLLSVPYALYAGNSQSKGKTSILITGNITNEQAAAQILAEFGPHTENVYIQNTTGLTTVDLSAFSSVVNLVIAKNSNLATINLNSLIAIYDSFIIKDNNALSTLSFPALTFTPSIEEQSTIENNPILTSISFPALVIISGDIDINNNDFLTSISFPVLVSTSGYCGIFGNDSLTSVLFPVLKSVNFLNISNNSKLTSIGITSLSSYNDSYLYFSGNALPSSQINTILNKLLNITLPNPSYIGLSGQIPPAPPTGQGLIDKQTLIDRGYNIYTD